MGEGPRWVGPEGQIRQGLAMEGERETQGRPAGIKHSWVLETEEAKERPRYGVRTGGWKESRCPIWTC